MQRRPANIQTDDLERCIQALDQACEWSRKAKPGDVAYAVGRAACVKESEVALELSGKLLKQRPNDCTWCPATRRCSSS